MQTRGPVQGSTGGQCPGILGFSSSDSLPHDVRATSWGPDMKTKVTRHVRTELGPEDPCSLSSLPTALGLCFSSCTAELWPIRDCLVIIHVLVPAGVGWGGGVRGAPRPSKRDESA